jgi:hypothetical protein
LLEVRGRGRPRWSPVGGLGRAGVPKNPHEARYPS